MRLLEADAVLRPCGCSASLSSALNTVKFMLRKLCLHLKFEVSTLIFTVNWDECLDLDNDTFKEAFG